MERRIEPYTVQITDTVHTAMLRITANRSRTVVVLDGETVVGVVSDGDIRRAFLREMLAITPVQKIMNINGIVTQERDPGRQRAIIRAEKVNLLPVVDTDHKLVDIVLGLEPEF